MTFFWNVGLPFLLSALLFLVLQLPRYNLATSYRDEGIIAYSASLVTQGKLPYRDFFSPIPPVSYFIQATLFTLFGHHLIVGRVAYIVLCCVMLGLLAWCIRVERKWKYLLLFSCALLLVWSGGFVFYNIYGQFFAVLSVAILLSYYRTKNRLLLACAGITTALLFFTKQSYGVFFIPAFMVIIAWYARKSFLRDLLTYTVPLAIVSLLIVSLLVTSGSFSNFFYYCFLFAREVKSHAFTYFIHRVVFTPFIFLGLYTFFQVDRRKKLVVLGVGAALVLVYLLLEPRRFGRLETYLIDPLFYYATLIYLLPITVVAALKKFPEKIRTDLIVLSVSLLAFYFGSTITGYGWVTIQTTGPVFLSLVVIIFASLATKFSNHSLAWYLSCASLLLLYPLPILVGPLNDVSMIYEMYPAKTATATSTIPLLKGLKFRQDEVEDLDRLRNYILANSDTSEGVMCFPYCPLVSPLVERNSNTFFNFFIFEMFRESDQAQHIEEMKNRNVKFVVIQKKGYIEPEAEFENEKYVELLNFIYQSYDLVFETENFKVYQKST